MYLFIDYQISNGRLRLASLFVSLLGMILVGLIVNNLSSKIIALTKLSLSMLASAAEDSFCFIPLFFSVLEFFRYCLGMLELENQVLCFDSSKISLLSSRFV